MSAPRPKQDKPRSDAARLVAFDLLRAVDEDQAYANLRLPVLLREAGLAGRDAGFATELAFGTLRLRGRYDAIIGLCASRGLDSIDPRVLDVLRLGAHQILGMKVPEYAAVSATVTMANQVCGVGPSKFVNAILRKIGRTPLADWLPQLPPPIAENLVGHLATAESHPRWIVDAFAAALAADGRDSGIEQLLAVNNTAPQVTLAARPGRITQAELIERTGGTPGRWSPWAVRITGDPGALPDVRSGASGVQDEGSQLMALALERATVTGPDDQWLDMCAGPGGKTALLSGLAQAAGASLTAVEQHPHRADLVRQTLANAAADVEVLTGDATTILPEQRYSRILLDAPCTGLGAVRRRPELRWRRQPSDLPNLRAMQSKLLKAACAAVTPGGVIAYVTCSPHLSETDSIVAPSLRASFEAVPAQELLPEVADLGPAPFVRLWPHLHDTDGMFLAVLRRRD